MNQNCGICEHWQQDMGIATVRSCCCPIKVWLEANNGSGPPPLRTHRDDGQDCKAWERRIWTDYLELWEAGKDEAKHQSAKASWKRVPIIRHVRYYWHLYWFSRWFYQFQQLTRGSWGIFPNQADLDYLQAIWDGKV